MKTAAVDFETLTMVNILLNQGDHQNALNLLKKIQKRDVAQDDSHSAWPQVKNRLESMSAVAQDNCVKVLENWLSALQRRR